MLYNFLKVILTGFYTGYLPFAPGTFGSLFAILLILLFPLLTNPLIIAILFIIGVIFSNYEEKISGIKDDPKIVIDEIVGIMVTFMGIKLNWLIIIIGFILFRFFDIYKPIYINKAQKLPAGWGVMLDDLLAGLLSYFILRIYLLL